MALQFYDDIDESVLVGGAQEIGKLQPFALCRVVSEENISESHNKRGAPSRSHSESDIQPPVKKKRKRVRFQVEPYEVVEAEPLPVDKCCWYSKDDLARSRLVARKLSSAVDCDPVLMETYYMACDTPTGLSQEAQHAASAVKLLKFSNEFWKQRGLERLSKNHAVSRSIQVCSVKTAVLLEQSNQYLAGVQDPERLAQVSRIASRPSQNFAEFLATADQALADKIHAETAKTTLALEKHAMPSQAVAPTA